MRWTSFRLWDTLWRSRWLIVSMTAAFAVGSAVYASFLPPMYTASVVLAPVREEPLSGLASQLGGLASLAGISRLGRDNTEAVAVLRSRDFVRAFIEEQGLLPVLFPDLWDAAAGRWTVEEPPDSSRRQPAFLSRTVRDVEEDATTGLVTLSIEWGDPELAAAWANLLAVRLNDHMRQRALAEAEANVKYLRHEFETTSIVALQQSISELLESEMQKLMLARGNSEYCIPDHRPRGGSPRQVEAAHNIDRRCRDVLRCDALRILGPGPGDGQEPQGCADVDDGCSFRPAIVMALRPTGRGGRPEPNAAIHLCREHGISARSTATNDSRWTSL